MVDISFYLVSEDIAKRCGSIGTAYRTHDGRYIVDNKDLSRIRMTPTEFMHGLKDVEEITKDQAKELIARNKYMIGEDTTQNKETPQNEDIVEKEQQNGVVAEQEEVAEETQDEAQTSDVEGNKEEEPQEQEVEDN